MPPTPEQGDEGAIIHAVLNGAVDRYAELVAQHQDLALRVALSLLGNYEDAKDVSQEAFVHAYRSLRRFRQGSRFSTWLYRIVVNACKDASRRRARRPQVVARVGQPDPGVDHADGLFVVEVDDPTADPSDQAANQELSHHLSQAIQELPMKQRTAFAMHHLNGLTLDEVASVMGCRVGTVKAHVFRAAARLRVRLAPWAAQEQA